MEAQKLVNVKGGTKFPCPNCGKATITRSASERAIATKYKCPDCGFEGPN